MYIIYIRNQNVILKGLSRKTFFKSKILIVNRIIIMNNIIQKQNPKDFFFNNLLKRLNSKNNVNNRILK